MPPRTPQYVGSIDLRAGFSQEEIILLGKLIAQNRLVATIDRDGAPFRRVTSITGKLGFPTVAVLWLDPAGLDLDLETPMEGGV